MIEALALKRQVRRKRYGICPECHEEFTAYVKNDEEFTKQECPYCQDPDIRLVSADDFYPAFVEGESEN